MVVSNLWCNGSHGISVGSLGQVRLVFYFLEQINFRHHYKYAGETDIVENVYVKNVTMRYAENGARIKVFGGSPDPSTSEFNRPSCGEYPECTVPFLQTAPLEEVLAT